MTARDLPNTLLTLAQRASRESIFDVRGKPLVDLATGGLGFGLPDITDRVKQQAERMGLSNRVMISPPIIELSHRLATMLPPMLSNAYICSSGEEAFEGALKLCKGLHSQRRSVAVVQGSELGSLSFARLLEQPQHYRELGQFLTLAPVILPPAIAPDAGELSHCYAICYSPLLRQADGSLQPIPTRFLQQLSAAATAAGIPLVCQATDYCLGLTGAMFGYEQGGICPDVLVLGGALGGQTIPVGCYLTSAERAYQIYGRSSPAKHGSTTGGNPLSCTAALAALDYAEQNDTPARFTALGKHIATSLAPYVRNVAGGVVNLTIPEYLEPASLHEHLLANGVLTRPAHGQTLTLYPMACSRTDVLAGALETIRSLFDDRHTH